jgi:hypothetical protein
MTPGWPVGSPTRAAGGTALRECLDQRHPRVGDVMVGPLRTALLDQALRIVNEIDQTSSLEYGQELTCFSDRPQVGEAVLIGLSNAVPACAHTALGHLVEHSQLRQRRRGWQRARPWREPRRPRARSGWRSPRYPRRPPACRCGRRRDSSLRSVTKGRRSRRAPRGQGGRAG